MSHTPYFTSHHTESSLIREITPEEPYRLQHAPRLQNWTDEQLANVRAALRRLTVLRIKNDQDAEDLVQETLLTMAAKCPEEVLRKGLLVWSMGILRKKLGNYYRKARRHIPLDDQEGLAWRLWQEEMILHSPESKLRHTELRSLIHDIVAGFPLPDRRAMEFFLAGTPIGEIVQLLQPEPYQNVVNRIFRGRRRIAKVLARYGYRPATARKARA